MVLRLIVCNVVLGILNNTYVFFMETLLLLLNTFQPSYDKVNIYVRKTCKQMVVFLTFGLQNKGCPKTGYLW